MKKILCLLDFESGFIRALLSGILKYSNEVANWSFCRIPNSYLELYGEEVVVGWAQDWDVDAVIGKISNKEVIAKLSALGIPIMLQNYKERMPGVSNITGDYNATGVMAAEFFMRKRYKNFAFYGLDDVIWSTEREVGFNETLSQRSRSLHVYNEVNLNKRGDDFDLPRLKAWLFALPKPVALFACDDCFALRIIELCRLYNIDVPNEVSVLGVDNDDLLCNMSDPTLSSIVLDVADGGYKVAANLDKMMKAKQTSSLDVFVKPVRIQKRKSTGYYDINDEVIVKVLKIIESAENKSVSVKTILEQIPISRRVLERRFKSEVGESVHQYIMKETADRIAEELAMTDRSVLDIAGDYGIYEYSNLSRLFKRFYNVTPNKFRSNM